MIFKKKSQILFFFSFNFISFIFYVSFCSIDLKRQSKFSGFCPDLTSLDAIDSLKIFNEAG